MTGRVVCECARDEPDVTMSCQGADPGMRGRWDWYTVLWLFQNCCSRGHLSLGGACLDHRDASDNAKSQGGQKMMIVLLLFLQKQNLLNTSVGVC